MIGRIGTIVDDASRFVVQVRNNYRSAIVRAIVVYGIERTATVKVQFGELRKAWKLLTRRSGRAESLPSWPIVCGQLSRERQRAKPVAKDTKEKKNV